MTVDLFSRDRLLMVKLYFRLAEDGIHELNFDFSRSARGPGWAVDYQVLSSKFLTNLSEDSCEIPDLLWEKCAPTRPF